MVKSGTVKFWDEKKKYGFIISDSQERTEYYTYSPYLSGIDRLWDGVQVSFEEKISSKGQLHAINVQQLNNN